MAHIAATTRSTHDERDLGCTLLSPKEWWPTPANLLPCSSVRSSPSRPRTSTIRMHGVRKGWLRLLTGPALSWTSSPPGILPSKSCMTYRTPEAISIPRTVLALPGLGTSNYWRSKPSRLCYWHQSLITCAG